MKSTTKKVKKVKAWAYPGELGYNFFIVSRKPDDYGQKIPIVITYSLPTNKKK